MVILYAWLLADFITGFVHWFQDKALTGGSRFEFLNRISRDNDTHHKKPSAMLFNSWWENINTSVYIAWPAAMVVFLLGCPTVVWLALVFAGFGNLVHRWSHLPMNRVAWPIRLMQWTGLFISQRHHQWHHFTVIGRVEKENTTKRYCPMTNWLNPILDGIGFFTFCTKVLQFLKG